VRRVRNAASLCSRREITQISQVHISDNNTAST
jgi:hypothetical protein